MVYCKRVIATCDNLILLSSRSTLLIIVCIKSETVIFYYVCLSGQLNEKLLPPVKIAIVRYSIHVLFYNRKSTALFDFILVDLTCSKIDK